MPHPTRLDVPVLTAKVDDLPDHLVRDQQPCDSPLFSRGIDGFAACDSSSSLPPISNTGVSDGGGEDDDWLDGPMVDVVGDGQSPPADVDPWENMVEDRWRFRLHWVTLTLIAEDGWSKHLPGVVMKIVSKALSRTPASRSDWRPYTHASYGYTQHATGLLEARLDWTSLTQTKEGHEHMSLSLPGQWCDAAGFADIRQLVDDLKSRFGVRCTRLDLAFDSDILKLAQFERAVERDQFAGAMKTRASRNPHKSTIVFEMIKWLSSMTGSNRFTITTGLRLGSYQSQRLVRVYDRRGDTRLEMQIREDMAQRHFNHLLCSDLEGVDVAWEALGCVRAYIEFVDRQGTGRGRGVPLLRWWKRFVKGSEVVTVPQLPKADSDSWPPLPPSPTGDESHDPDTNAHGHAQVSHVEEPSATPPATLADMDGEYPSNGARAGGAHGQLPRQGPEGTGYHDHEGDHVAPHRPHHDNLWDFDMPHHGRSGSRDVGRSPDSLPIAPRYSREHH